MAIMVKEPETTYTPAPAGTHPAVCCDVVDLGEVTSTWGTKPMIRVVWQIEQKMQDGRPFTCNKRYTASLHEKSTLRADLESWRGRKLSTEELHGFDLERLIGVNALVNIIVEEKDGKVYSNVKAIMPPLKSMTKLAVTPEFVRRKDREGQGVVSSGASSGHRDDWQREPGGDLDNLGDCMDDAPAENDDPFA